MTTIKLDLHHIYTDSRAIDDALQRVFDEAIDRKIRQVEIISGKEAGKLMKKIDLFLQQPSIKSHYQRMDISDKKKGVLLIYFKY